MKWIVLLVLFTLWNGCSAEELNPVDQDVLLDMIHALHGLPNDWQENDFVNACNWTGVGCYRPDGQNDSRVISINLEDVGVFGVLPSSLSNLSECQLFNFNNNFLHGALPALPKGAHQFYFSNNSLTGPLPEPTYATNMFLQNNKFTGCIPQSWQDFKFVNSISGCSILNNYFNCSEAECMKYLPEGCDNPCHESTVSEEKFMLWPLLVGIFVALVLGLIAGLVITRFTAGKRQNYQQI